MIELNLIADAMQAGRIRITDHADEEAAAVGISIEQVLKTVSAGEIIEQYPDDKPYPSGLIYSDSKGPLHSVWAYNETNSWTVFDHRVSSRPAAVDQLAIEETKAMTPFERCPVCGGELVERQVQKLLRGGRHTGSITVPAEVCLHCGERLYSRDVVKKFEEIRTKLERQETDDFEPIGQSFEVR